MLLCNSFGLEVPNLMCVSAMQALELELELCGSGGIAACPRHSISILLSLNLA
jgi:hypothetical protein